MQNRGYLAPITVDEDHFAEPDPTSNMVAWVGIGSGSSGSQPLIQAGVALDIDQNGSATKTFWYEVYPQFELTPIDMVPDGPSNYVAVEYLSQSARFTICKNNYILPDDWTCSEISYQLLLGPDNIAEWIVEKGVAGKSFAPFDPVAFSGVRSQQEKFPLGTGYTSCSDLTVCDGTVQRINIVDGTTFATTSMPGSTGGEFTLTREY